MSLFTEDDLCIRCKEYIEHHDETRCWGDRHTVIKDVKSGYEYQPLTADGFEITDHEVTRLPKFDRHVVTYRRLP